MNIINPNIVSNKKILLRVDYNVDLDEKGKIISDFRLRASLETINFLLKYSAQKIIIVSHLGRPEGKEKKLSLEPIAKHLEKLLKKRVVFLGDCIGNEIKNTINNSKEKIFLLENLRFYKEEENNDELFAQKLADLADIYINDAFGVSHRLNASVAAITKFLPSYAGFLMKKEVENLSKIKDDAVSPFVIVLGGAKISTKLPLIKAFLNKADYILLGGGLANTFWKAWGFNVGKSLVEEKMIEEAKNLGSQKAELILPGDLIVASDFNDKNGKTKEIGEIKEKDIIVDIGPVATQTFVNIIKNAQTILWNGPMGYWENKKFRDGTEKIAKAIAKNKNFTVVGGGETLTAIEELGLLDEYHFVSTGGGAMLDFLSSNELSALKFLQ
ncbi:MAG: phosphoglycerate kinase [Patescibacteria group bacterium]|jgi:3-phosphoglycerate kinase|nr:phosphoglycerate kinase [Patescibacteria group bacterium]